MCNKNAEKMELIRQIEREIRRMTEEELQKLLWKIRKH